MDNETGSAIARQLNRLNTNLEKLNDNHEALLNLQEGEDKRVRKCIHRNDPDDCLQCLAGVVKL